MSSPSIPDGNPDPIEGIRDDSVRQHPSGIDLVRREFRSPFIDVTLRDTGVSGSGIGQEWTGMGGWRIRGKLGVGGEAELFVVGREAGEIAILKAYVFEEREAKQEPVMPDPEVLDAIRDLTCPWLVRILEHGIAAEGGCLAGRYCEVIEECEGQIQARHWDDEAELLALVRQVAKALQALHSRRIAHRDVKPANILIGGAKERLYKLGDYGIATFANRRSRLGRRDASPMYASPAQMSGLVSTTDDWWSLGMIVQESLLGRHPHAGKSPAEIQRSYVTQEFRPQVPRAVSDRWKPLLEGLLDYDPEKRWSDEEVLRWCEGGLVEVQAIAGGMVVSETAGWLRRAWLFLEDGEFESAKEYAERVLDREPETGEAYWVKALAGFGVRRESDLGERRQSLIGDSNYKKALRFGTAELKRRLEGAEADIQKLLRLDAEAIKDTEKTTAPRPSKAHLGLRTKSTKSVEAKAECKEHHNLAGKVHKKAAGNRIDKEGLQATAKARTEKRAKAKAKVDERHRKKEEEAQQRTEAERMAQARRQFDLALEEDLNWVRILLKSLDPEEEVRVKHWLKQGDWKELEAPLQSVQQPKNRELIRLNPSLCPIIEKTEWTYRESVALCIFISSRQFDQLKEAEQTKRSALSFVIAEYGTYLLGGLFAKIVPYSIKGFKELDRNKTGLIFLIGVLFAACAYQHFRNCRNSKK